MLGQRRRRWANINPALGKLLVFADAQQTQNVESVLVYRCPPSRQWRWTNVKQTLI